ncbi:hypothetical protein V6Z11_D03G042800 [Gossypium hirsutum]
MRRFESKYRNEKCVWKKKSLFSKQIEHQL